LAGADFGGGVWDLLASGPRAREQRRAVAEAMGPVWEANHVWLIFLIVGLFTALPAAFGILSLALYLPFTIALLGIVLRWAAIASLVLAPFAAPSLAHSLFGGGLPLLILALVNGPIALIAVWRSKPRLARFTVAAQVVFVLWAWAVGQWPYLVPPDLTFEDSAAPGSTLTALLVVIAVGMALLLPSLWLLFRVFKARNPAVLE